MRESKRVEGTPEFETIKITIPKNTLALSTVSIYEGNGQMQMFTKVFDTSDLKELKGADNI
jgi:hypothetical protein